MPEYGTNKKALHKEVSSIFGGVWITKEAGIRQQPSASGSIGDGYIVPNPSTVGRQTRLEPVPAHHDCAHHKTVRHARLGTVAIINAFNRVIRRIFPSRSRREEKRLRSNWDNWRC